MISRFLRFFFAPLRPYITTAPVHYQLKNPSFRNFWGWKPLASWMYASESLRQEHTHLDVNERIIEVPWVLNQVNFDRKGKVLDVGWLESTVSTSLATASFQVTGIDIRAATPGNYPKQPNFTPLQADICKTELKSNTFDYVIMLSTLEHIGLDTLYGKSPAESSDQAAIHESYRLLKKGGVLLLTTPVARKASQNEFMRIYTPKKLRQLLINWDIMSVQYFIPQEKRQFWTEVEESELLPAASFGVALIKAQKATQ